MNEMVVIKNNEIIVDATVIEKIKDFKKAKAQMDLVEKELNKLLKEAMEKVGLKKFIVNGLCATIKDDKLPDERFFGAITDSSIKSTPSAKSLYSFF